VIADEFGPVGEKVVDMGDYEIRAIGIPRVPLRDLYHAMLRLSWPWTIAVIVLSYLGANAIFAGVYLAVGGVDHVSTFLQAFFFSVQTMGTIGYGVMSPVSNGANVVMVAESVFSLLLTAVSTGLVFAKFSRPTARVMFTHNATISKINGKPTLAFRIGNERSNRIVEARIRVVLVRTETTTEGKTFYRNLDMKLERDRIMSLQRSWTVMHVIDEKSPLYGETEESAAKEEIELLITVMGTDDIWMQTVHAGHRYAHHQIAWGKRLADVLSEDERGLLLDLRKFHELEAETP
jgi:inward rectifier potassium channel